MRRIVALIALSVGLLVGCSSGPDAPAPQAASGTAGPGAAAGQRFPDIVGVEVSGRGELHPPALVEPGVRVSPHRAPTDRPGVRAIRCQWARSWG